MGRPRAGKHFAYFVHCYSAFSKQCKTSFEALCLPVRNFPSSCVRVGLSECSFEAARVDQTTALRFHFDFCISFPSGFVQHKHPGPENIFIKLGAAEQRKSEKRKSLSLDAHISVHCVLECKVCVGRLLRLLKFTEHICLFCFGK